MSDIYNRVAKELPNFPRDIVEQWIGYYAETDGWPPTSNPLILPQGRWLSLLLNKPLSYWRRVIWKEEIINVNEINLDPEVMVTIEKIIKAHTQEELNSYSEFIPDGKIRFDSILKDIAENGKFTRKPILIYEDNYFDIADGMHRIAACLFISNTRYSGLKEEYLKEIKVNSVELNGDILVWLGTQAP